MLSCANFLEEYSGYRDGVAEGSRREEFSRHLASCPSCARYDRVIREGVAILTGLSPVRPSEDFRPRLQRRLQRIRDRARKRAHASGVPFEVTVALVLAIAAGAWAPLLRPRPATVRLAPVVAHAPHRVEALGMLFREGPLLSEPGPGQLTRQVADGDLLFPRSEARQAYRLLPMFPR